MIQEISKYNGLTFNDSIKHNYESKRNNNCYTYAINQPKNPKTTCAYANYSHCQPGNLGGGGIRSKASYSDNKLKSHEIIILARKDLKQLGYSLLKTTYKKYITDLDCWKVAFCLSDDDYHWYRQNDDGTWSNKRGDAEVTNKDYSGEIIHNPEECDRGEYEFFVGFYLIKKIEGVENKCS